MSRHGYTNSCDDELAAGRWRGMVQSAIRGNRGQKLLRDMRDALDAMPNKRLIAEELVSEDGECCALGAVAVARGIDTKGIDPECPEQVGAAFDIADCLAQEITYHNDDSWHKSDEDRWQYMRKWVEARIKAAAGD